MAFKVSIGRGPHASQHPQALKGLTPPQLLTPEEEAAHSASWEITLGHRRRQGLKTASVSSVNGSGLIAIRVKTGQKGFPTQNPRPGRSLAPWPLTCGPEALVGTLGICGGEHRATSARPARERVYTRHVTAGNLAQSSPFKHQHLKYSPDEPEAKYGLAYEGLVWTFSCHSKIQSGTHGDFWWPGVQLLRPNESLTRGWEQLPASGQFLCQG